MIVCGFDVDYYLFDGVLSLFELDIVSDFDLSMYDCVELVKGVNGLMMGVGNFLIVINMVCKYVNVKEFIGILSLFYGLWNVWNSMVDIFVFLNIDGSVCGWVVVKYESIDVFVDLYEKENNLFYSVIDVDLIDNIYLLVGVSY